MRFETERMMVRSFQEGDLPDLQEILGDAQTMVYMEPPYTLEQTARFLQDFCIGRKGALAAEDKASGRVIGYLLCNEIQDDIYEIGWIFNRRIWRQGYAYEACCSLVDYAFFSLHAHKLLAETIDPLKSAGLMRKLGMELEGVQRGQVKRQWGPVGGPVSLRASPGNLGRQQEAEIATDQTPLVCSFSLEHTNGVCAQILTYFQDSPEG